MRRILWRLSVRRKAGEGSGCDCAAGQVGGGRLCVRRKAGEGSGCKCAARQAKGAAANALQVKAAAVTAPQVGGAAASTPHAACAGGGVRGVGRLCVRRYCSLSMSACMSQCCSVGPD